MHFSTLLLFIVCLVVSFLYSGIEAGLSSLNRARLRSRIHQGDRAAIRLGRLLAHPGRLLATVLLVTNFADVAALVILTHALFVRFGGWGCVAAGAIMLPVYLLGLQILPKSLFRRFPYRALVALVGVLEITSKFLWPLLALGSRLTPASAGHDGKRGLFAARDDLKVLAAEGERAGALSPAERGMIHNVIDFSTVPARELMRPPSEALRLRDDLRVIDLLEFAQERKMDFVPVLDAGGKAVALVDVFALLLDRDPTRPAAVYLRRPPLVVPPNEPALRVLRRLRAGRLGAAAVFDGATNFAGIVRTADLVQRLVRQGQAQERAGTTAQVNPG